MVTKAVLEVKVGTQTIPVLSIEYNIIGPSATQPNPSSSEFTVKPTPIELDGVKYWVEWRSV